jgi:hypothetical protein
MIWPLLVAVMGGESVRVSANTEEMGIKLRKNAMNNVRMDNINFPFLMNFQLMAYK